MTGDAPQPGETPRDESSPWSSADPASPWFGPDESDPAADRPRQPRRRAAPAASPAASATPTLDLPQPAEHTGEAAEAHRAGAQDVHATLTNGAPQGATDEATVRAELATLIGQGLSKRDAAAAAADKYGLSKRDVYQMTLEGGG